MSTPKEPVRQHETADALQDAELDEVTGGGVIAPQHAINSPRDPASGLPTGKRQHKPMEF